MVVVFSARQHLSAYGSDRFLVPSKEKDVLVTTGLRRRDSALHLVTTRRIARDDCNTPGDT